MCMKTKGTMTNCPIKRAILCPKWQNLRGIFGVFCRHFAGFAHENRSGGGFTRQLASLADWRAEPAGLARPQTLNRMSAPARAAAGEMLVRRPTRPRCLPHSKTQVHPAMLSRIKKRPCSRPQTLDRMSAPARPHPTSSLGHRLVLEGERIRACGRHRSRRRREIKVSHDVYEITDLISNATNFRYW
jgi:hypothetical protein